MTRKKNGPESLGRVSALVVLAVCFLASAALRTGDVIAALPADGDDGYGNPVVQPGQGQKKAAADPQPEPNVLIAELKRQSTALKAREAQLDAREQALKAIEKRLNQRLRELRTAGEGLESTAARVDNAAGKDVQRLAEMYQQMKPKQAGQIFNEMAPSFAAGFLAEMRPDAAALIMANMAADKAYAVSLLMAGRNIKRRPQTSQTGTQ